MTMMATVMAAGIPVMRTRRYSSPQRICRRRQVVSTVPLPACRSVPSCSTGCMLLRAQCSRRVHALCTLSLSAALLPPSLAFTLARQCVLTARLKYFCRADVLSLALCVCVHMRAAVLVCMCGVIPVRLNQAPVDVVVLLSAEKPPITFIGECVVTVLHGSVDVNGYVAGPDSKPMVVSSSAATALATIAFAGE